MSGSKPVTARTKHTPGPWLPSRFGSQVLTGDSWSTICTIPGPAKWEDQRGDYEQEYEWQNQEANARLIAAAPDLLEALRDVIDCVMGGIAPRTAWEKARAAIAKAEAS